MSQPTGCGKSDLMKVIVVGAGIAGLSTAWSLV
ncbi:FAD-binding oxidoreductase, partial [Mesorhizobium sp. M7A.F.Ca.CA.001.09.2.1]